VTAAGLVSAVAMASMVTSDLVVIGQGGTTIGLGLLVGMSVVRSLMNLSIAAVLAAGSGGHYECAADRCGPALIPTGASV